MKNKTSIFITMIILVGVGFSNIAQAQTVITGATEDGAFYTIAVPDIWNGDLVIWNHGLNMDPPGPVPDLGPLAPLQLQQVIRGRCQPVRGLLMRARGQFL